MAYDGTEIALATLAADIARVARLVITAARLAGWPVVIQPLGGYRSPAQQAALYAQGRTTPGRVVTWTEHSAHETGRAFDLDLAGYDRSVGMPLWTALGHWWESIGGKWGGRYGDYGHFEG